MKVIIDTNVLISAALRNGLPESVILHIVAEPMVEWLASAEIMTEYQAVIARPVFGFSASKLGRWRGLLADSVKIVPVKLQLVFFRDHKDAKFLACAAETGADFLITGDRDFSEAPAIPGCRIVTVREFANLL